MRRVIVAFAALAVLAGCTASSINATTAAKVSAIDYVNDDIGSVLIAFDVPLTIEPVPDGSTMVFTLGDRTLTATLARADIGDGAASLPPPKADRTYYLFGFTEADKARIRTLQNDARALGARAPLTVALTPRFCRVGAIDAARTRFSVLLALPGSNGALEPFISNSTLEAAFATGAERNLPLCEGVSG